LKSRELAVAAERQRTHDLFDRRAEIRGVAPEVARKQTERRTQLLGPDDRVDALLPAVQRQSGVEHTAFENADDRHATDRAQRVHRPHHRSLRRNRPLCNRPRPDPHPALGFELAQHA
jgi:hypothetical protein